MSDTPRSHGGNFPPPVGLDPAYRLELLTAVGDLPPEFDTSPLYEDYATMPLHLGYDLPVIFNRLREEDRLAYGLIHGVAYGSDRRDGIPDDAGSEGDYWAHMAARLADGYIYYCKGPILVPGRALSFCLWENEEFAKLGSDNPAHDYARNLAPQMYNLSIVQFLDVNYQPEGITIVDKRPPHVIDYNTMTSSWLPAEQGTYSQPVFIPVPLVA